MTLHYLNVDERNICIQHSLHSWPTNPINANKPSSCISRIVPNWKHTLQFKHREIPCREMSPQNERAEADAALQGQAYIWRNLFAFGDTMILKSAIDLHIADIIHSHGKPITLTQLAEGLDTPSPNLDHLSRTMRMLVRRKIFTAHPQSESEDDTLYGLTHASKWLVHGTGVSMGPMMEPITPEIMAPFYHISHCVKTGGTAFKEAHGKELYEYASENPKFNDLFNEGMANTAKNTIKVFLKEYKDGFDGIETLVDVGGGIGLAIGEIVKSYPHIKGINFDLPHVVATAPSCEGVSHIGGDMFKSIPRADAVFMMFVLHNWGDEACIQALKNCREAIPKTGKVIIVDIVLNPESDDLLDDTAMLFDVFMMAYCPGGKERSVAQWKKLLQEAGFPRFNIIRLPCYHSAIEAFLQ